MNCDACGFEKKLRRLYFNEGRGTAWVEFHCVCDVRLVRQGKRPDVSGMRAAVVSQLRQLLAAKPESTSGYEAALNSLGELP